MHVVKRNGATEPVSFDKVSRRIRNLCEMKPTLSIDPLLIAQKVCGYIYDGVKTTELDELSAEICTQRTVEHTEYGTLASRIIISNNHKNTSSSFTETISQLYHHTDETGKLAPLISEEVYKFVMDNKRKLNAHIDYARDFLYDYFGFKTLEKAYLLRINGYTVERIQHLFMRVACGLHTDSLKRCLETYDMMSKKWFTHATPTLFHCGTNHPQLLSCFLFGVEDSVSGIYKSISDCAQISKWAGGIGLHIHDVRGENSLIHSTNGRSSGIIPMLKVFNDVARHINQCFTPDTIVYTSNGPKRIVDVNIQDRVLTSDGTYRFVLKKAVRYVEEESLVSIHTRYSVKPLRTTGVHQILILRRADYIEGKRCPEYVSADSIQEGDYMAFPIPQETPASYRSVSYVPHTNVESKELHAEVIRQQELTAGHLTNVAYVGDTYHVFADTKMEGYFTDQSTYNGNQKPTLMFNCVESMMREVYTGLVYDLNVEDNHNYTTASGLVHNSGKRNGSFAMYLEPHHPDILGFLEAKKNHGDENVRARDLFYGMWLSDLFMKRVQANQDWSLLCPDTCRGLSDLYGEAFEAKYIEYESDPRKVIKRLPAMDIWREILKSQMETGTPYLCYKDAANRKSNQQHYGTIKSSNLCTEIMEYSDHKEYACCTLASLSLPACLDEMDLSTVHQITIYSKTGCKNCDLAKRYVESHHLPYEVILLDDDDTRNAFFDKINRTDTDNISTSSSDCVGGACDVVSANANRKYRSVPQVFVNGNHIGGFDALYRWFRPRFNFQRLMDMTKVVTGNLNKVIDLNFYPVPETELSNKRHRPLGIGVQGLADVYARLRMPFDSEEASQLNREIFACIYYASCMASVELATAHREAIRQVQEAPLANRSDLMKRLRVHSEDLETRFPGAYATFEGSPIQQGKFQFDLWGQKPLEEVGESVRIRLDWDSLRRQIQTQGMRNSLLLAPMPTASTSQILGNNECIEPFTSNIYSRGTIAGQFLIVNKYLLDDLQRLGLWSESLKESIIIKNGSVASFKEIPQCIRDTYKITWDLSMKTLIDQASDRGIYVCQSQSLNLWMEDPTMNKLTSMHFYAWKKGLKTGMYYLRRRAVSKAQSFTIDPLKEKEIRNQLSVSSVPTTTSSLIGNSKEEECLMCSS